MAEAIVQELVYSFGGDDSKLNAAFNKAESSSKTHVSAVNSHLKGIGSTINVNEHFVRSSKNVEKEATAHVGRLNHIFSHVGEGIKEKVGGIAGGVASVFGGGFLLNAVQGGEQAIEKLAEVGLKFAEDWEKAHLRMTAFSGDAHAATVTLQTLDTLAQDRAMEFSQLADAAFHLEEIGIKGDRSISIMKGITAQAAVLGKGAEGVHAIVSQLEMMEDSGKATGRGLMNLERQGYQVFSTLSKMTGIEKVDLRKMLMSGKLDPKVAIDLLTEGWEKQFGVAAGQVTKTFSDEQTRTMQILAPQLATAMDPMIDVATHTMTRIQAVISQAGPGFAEGISGAMSLAGSALTKAMDYLITLAGIKLKVESPSKVFQYYGEMVMQGLADGFLSNKDKAQRSLEQAYQRILSNDALQKIVAEASQRFNVPTELINAVMAKESSGIASAKSLKGARGLMQVMPFNAPGANLYDPTTSIMTGTKMLADRMVLFPGEIQKVLASYNSTIERARSGNLLPETKDYVARITSLLSTRGTPQSPTGTMSMLQSPIYQAEAQVNLQEYNDWIKKSNDRLSVLATRYEVLTQSISQLTEQADEMVRVKARNPELDAYGQYTNAQKVAADQLRDLNVQREKIKTLQDAEIKIREGHVGRFGYVGPPTSISAGVDIGIGGIGRPSTMQGLQSLANRQPTTEDLVRFMLTKSTSGPLTTTGGASGATLIGHEFEHLQMPMSSFMKRVEESSASVGKLVNSTDALVDAQTRESNEIKIRRMESIGTEASRRIKGEIDPLAVRQTEIDELVNIPKSISTVAYDFITKFDFTWKSAQQILVGGIKSVIVEPFAKIIQTSIQQWVSQMLINLLGEKIMGATHDTVTTINTAAVTANAAAVGVNTAAVTALTLAMGGSEASSILGNIGHAIGIGAGAGGRTGGIVRYADGSLNFPGGIGVIGEEGPELVHLPSGSHIYNNSETRSMLSKGGGNTNINITLNAPVIGGSSYAQPRSRREYIDMLAGPLQHVLGNLKAA